MILGLKGSTVSSCYRLVRKKNEARIVVGGVGAGHVGQ